MTNEQLDWLEKVNIILKRWTRGKTISSIVLGSRGTELTLVLSSWDVDGFRATTIAFEDKWLLQPSLDQFSEKEITALLQAQEEVECHHKSKHFAALCEMFDKPEITDASITAGNHLLLTFGHEIRMLIQGSPQIDYSMNWKVTAGPHNLIASQGKLEGIWDPYELRDEIKNIKAESQ